MTRLTNNIRDNIVKNAIAASSYPGIKKKYDADRQDLANKIRLFAIGDGADELDALQQDIIKQTNAFFEYFPNLVSIRSMPAVAHYRGSIAVYLPGDNYSKDFYFNESKPSPYSVTFKADNELVQLIYDIEERHKEIEELHDEIGQSVRGIINSVGTVKRLLEVWPESEKLIPTDSAPKPPVPVLPIGDVNKLLGLGL